ncbi:MAG: DUF554 domain-containing protein [Oscillospiraceae bacterium]|nr:DUF554 domain-containing protein [Oscillospiraceae bacterium]
MIAVFVNMATVLVGSLLGILFRNRLKVELQNAVMRALALCTFVIGISSAITTQELLCVIICLVIGTVLGEWIRIDDAIENAGDTIKAKLFKGKVGENRFTEGFVSACILFCIGSMTIVGSLEAGIHHDYSIIYAKSTLDFVSSMAFGAAMGVGVTCSVVFILLFQGGLTLLAGLIGPALSTAVVTEMSAVGGTILIGMALNMLGATKERIRVANMLPAIFLPIAYFPITNWLGSLF